MKLDDRRARVLRAVVHDFIRTAEPVGSKTLAQRYDLGVSPATIRNDMAVLEEQGYLSHPHTSAGRVPTDTGYRFYVDSLTGVGRLARQQEQIISSYFEGTAELEETLRRTSVLLSELTDYAAMVSPPALDRSRLRHVELVPLGRHVLMLVLIVDTGRVEKRLVEVPHEAPDTAIEDLRRKLNEALVGERLDRVDTKLASLGERIAPGLRWLFDAAATAIQQVAADQAGPVWIEGRSNLAGPKAFEGLDTIRAVYQALEQQVVVLRLLQNALDGEERVTVTIGTEHTIEAMQACSLVTATYIAGDSVGSIGVLGPTRMDYLRAMAAVQAVARFLGDALEDVER